MGWQPCRKGTTMQVRRYCLIPLLGAAASAVGIVTAPVAASECVSSGAATVCAQGEVRGGGGPAPTVATPWVPYPCEDDWLCDGGGLSIVLNPRGGGGGITVGGGGITIGGGR